MTADRILLAGFFHETHTFVTDTTPLADFSIRRGDALLARRGDGSTVDGFLEVVATAGWNIVPVSEYTALPSGPIEHAVLEAFCEELAQGLAAALADGGLSGIWLALHGAGVTTECVDVEGTILSRLRDVPGAEMLPVFGVFDLHATFTDLMARHANALVGYRENPHIDALAAAVLSAELLARSLREGTLPRMYSRRVPLIWPPTGTGTAGTPMRDLEALARRFEADDPEIWAANVVGGFSFSDIPDAGVAFSVVTTGKAVPGEAALDGLAELAMRLRDEGQPDEWDLDAALDDMKGRAGGPWIIVEPADNIGGGAPGDGTSVLRALLAHGVANSAVAIADPQAVAAFADAAPGDERRIAVGGKLSPLDPGPVEVTARLVSRSDGRFEVEDRQSRSVRSTRSRRLQQPRRPKLPSQALTVIEYPETPDIPRSHLPFSPVTKVGSLLFVSGQASVDAGGKIIPDTFEGEMRRAMENLSKVLEAAGSDLAHVAQTRNYVQDSENTPEFNRIYRDYFADPLPARTTITNCLPANLRFEIDCVAVVRDDVKAQGAAA